MTSSSESFCRDRRLFDVRRGVVYLRRTDNLAQRQWRHYGAVPAIKTHVIRDIGVTSVLPDVSMSQQSDVTLDDSHTDLRDTADSRLTAAEDPNGVVRKHEDVHVNVSQGKSTGLMNPKISLTTVSRNEHILNPETPKPSPPPLPPVDNALVTFHSPPQAESLKSPSPISGVSSGATGSIFFFSHDGQNLSSSPPFSTSKDERHLMRESQSLAAGHVSGGPFNTWGSRDSETSADRVEPLQPKNYAPKHYQPMSRAVGVGRKGAERRQLRTLTDFRSRNGTIRIIRPLAPNIDNKRMPGAPDDDEELFDVEALDREKTYAMLKRIDRLLEPNRAFFTSDLASSLREVTVCSSASTPSTLSLADTAPKSPDPLHHQRDPDTGQSNQDFSFHAELTIHARPTHNPRRRLPPVQQPNPSELRHRSRKHGSDLHRGHGHPLNPHLRSRGPHGVGGLGGPGGQASAGQASLATVVRRLESKGMDLHQKCQDWIKKYFSGSDGTTTQRSS